MFWIDPDAFWQWNVMGLLQNSPFLGGAKPHRGFGCGINAAALFKSSYPHFTVVLLLDIPKSLGTAH